MIARTIVITGASSGIGAAFAIRLGRDGHRLVLAARRTPDLMAIAEAARNAGSPGAIAVETDVTSRAQVNRLRDRAIMEFGGFDTWVNNAGQGINRPVLELTDEDVDQVIAVNLKSALYGMQAATSHFIERGQGHLVNISSFLSRMPVAGIRSVYSAAKAALNSLTANLRMDLHDRYPGIKVSLVLPGVVQTDFGRHAIGASLSPGGTPPLSVFGIKPQTVDEVVEVLMTVMATPVAEVYTNPLQKSLVERYLADVAGMEDQIVSQLRPS